MQETQNCIDLCVGWLSGLFISSALSTEKLLLRPFNLYCVGGHILYFSPVGDNIYD